MYCKLEPAQQTAYMTSIGTDTLQRQIANEYEISSIVTNDMPTLYWG